MLANGEPMTREELEVISGLLASYDFYNDMGQFRWKCAPFDIELVRKMRDEISRLRAALDAAERRAEAAKSDIEELLGQEDYLGVCWACRKNDTCQVGGHVCVPAWRGPCAANSPEQGGEG